MKGYVSTCNGQMHYRRCGPARTHSSSSTIVLLHQRPSSSLMWTPVLPLLANRGFDAIAFDLPGHGESFHPKDEEFTLPFFSASVAQAVESMGLGSRSISLVGHHFGAAVALQIAADFPDMVSKLALWGVPILDKTVASEGPPAPDFTDEDLKNVVQFWKIRNKFSTRPGYVMSPSLRASKLVEMLQSNSKVADLISSMDVKKLLGLVTQPTLCMCGDHELLKDATIGAAKELPNGSLCFIPNGGLDVQEEYPEEFAKALEEFLKN